LPARGRAVIADARSGGRGGVRRVSRYGDNL
jgi:hypothetical protein